MLSTCVTKIHHLLLISLPYLYVCLIRLQQTYFFSMEKTNRYIHEYTFYFYLVAFTFYYWKEIWFSSGYKLHVFFTTKSRLNVYRVHTKQRYSVLRLFVCIMHSSKWLEIHISKVNLGDWTSWTLAGEHSQSRLRVVIYL